MSDGIKSLLTSIAVCVGAVLIVVLIVCGLNSTTSKKWNGGVCPNCNVSYELRAVSNGIKYYSCPKCHEEVKRFTVK